jgi:hypothetical protein
LGPKSQIPQGLGPMVEGGSSGRLNEEAVPFTTDL